MLAYPTKAGWAIWVAGSRVPSLDGGKGLTPPKNAEAAFSDDGLAKLGLYRVTREEIPEGKIATDWSLVDDKGLPVYRPTLEDAPPPPTAAELAAQFDRIEGKTTTVELALRAVISLLADRMGVTDAQAKAAVRNRMQAIAEGTRG